MHLVLGGFRWVAWGVGIGRFLCVSSSKEWIPNFGAKKSPIFIRIRLYSRIQFDCNTFPLVSLNSLKQLNLVVDSKLNLSRRGALIYWRGRSCDQENSDTKYVFIKFQLQSCKVASGWWPHFSWENASCNKDNFLLSVEVSDPEKEDIFSLFHVDCWLNQTSIFGIRNWICMEGAKGLGTTHITLREKASETDGFKKDTLQIF